ncbi:MAG: hypothetical protein JST64_02945 [Actinobacteria bacterium]|nr:hypothetical protein [Actinomycetota bacterium]
MMDTDTSTSTSTSTDTSTAPRAGRRSSHARPPRRRQRLGRTAAALVVGLGLGVAPVALPAVAGASPATTTPTARCIPADGAKARAAAEVARRQATLADLQAALGRAGDPYQLNAAQTAALQSASSGLSSLGEKIATTCYTDRSALTSDVQSIFFDYRVYALRVPQTHTIEAADRLGSARGELGRISGDLASIVGQNPAAQAALAAMDQSLAAADATLGQPPTISGAVAAVPGLQPQQDLAPTRAAMVAARTDLRSTRRDLAAAEAHAVQVLVALGR